jgi:hypothetical protein
MSSFNVIKTCMTEQDVLKKSLEDLGYNPTSSDTKQKVRGHYNETRQAEIVVSKEELKDGGDIGFSKDKEGNFEVVMDTYVMRSEKTKKLMADIKMKYTTNMTLRAAKLNGWTTLNKGTEVVRDGKRFTRLQFAVA